jgi:protease IV
MDDGSTNNSWERKTLDKLLFETLKEKRRERRWRIFFRVLFFGYVFYITAIFIMGSTFKFPEYVKTKSNEHSAIINILGVIADNELASAENVIQALQVAFANTNAKAVILRINSPGGTPVQARQVYDEIKRLRSEYKEKQIYAAIEDYGMSGAYLIASAADKIYSDETSLLGSIGVRLSTFGFVDAMQKLGIERRSFIAGEDKGMLDPFSPLQVDAEIIIQEQLGVVHQQFINNVKQGRGTKLKETEDMFSGRFWVGVQALDLGLIDGFADHRKIARDIIGVSEMIDYTQHETFFNKFRNGFKSMSMGFL